MNTVITVVKKELLEVFRDKRSIIFTILLPIFIYPIMFGLIFLLGQEKVKDFNKNTNVGIVGESNSEVAQVIKTLNGTSIFSTNCSEGYKSYMEMLKSGKLQLIIELPKNLRENIDSMKTQELKVYLDSSSSKSVMTYDKIAMALSEYKIKTIKESLKKEGVPEQILSPFTLNDLDGVNPAFNGDGKYLRDPLLKVIEMMPMMVIVFLLMPIINMASDIGAGEKDRATIQSLISTSAGRKDIFIGKLISICIIALITLLASIISLSASIGPVFNMGKYVVISGFSVALIILLSILTAFTISSASLAISIFSKSVKEAGAYLSGIMLLFLMLSYVPMMVDAKSIPVMYFHIPIVNTLSLVKELLVGKTDMIHILTVFIWNFIYIVLSVILATRTFDKENAIFRS